MKGFLFVQCGLHQILKGSPEEMQSIAKNRMDWYGSIAAQNKLADRGNRLIPGTAKVVKVNNVVTDGPFMEIKETIGGYGIIKGELL